jgi:hypothetical protein
MTAALERGECSAARPGRNLPPGKTRYPFYRRLGGPQGRSGRAENLVPAGIRSLTVQPVPQSLYRLSYPAHILNLFGAENYSIIKTDLNSNVNIKKFYSYSQYLLHFSAVLTTLMHLNMWEWSVRQNRMAFIDKTDKMCCGRRQQYVGFHKMPQQYECYQNSLLSRLTNVQHI